jgi:formiminotetrahydrofolate cyclodeaminase
LLEKAAKGDEMDSFLEELAQPRPNPGGGAAAAYGARLGLALLEKVVQLEANRRLKPPSESFLTWEEALSRVRQLAADLGKLQEDDVEAYSQLATARASGGDLATAVHRALEPPRQIVRQTGEALELLALAGGRCQLHLVSDLLVAGEFLGAALAGAYHIVCANLRLITPEETRKALKLEFCQDYQKGENLLHLVKAALVARENGFARCGR